MERVSLLGFTIGLELVADITLRTVFSIISDNSDCSITISFIHLNILTMPVDCPFAFNFVRLINANIRCEKPG